MESNREYCRLRLHNYGTILNRGRNNEIQTECFPSGPLNHRV